MNKLLTAIIYIANKMAMPLAIKWLKENEDALAKKFADSNDIPLIGEKAEKQLAAGVIAAVVELLEGKKA